MDLNARVDVNFARVDISVQKVTAGVIKFLFKPLVQDK